MSGRIPTPKILKHLYSLDNSSPDFSRYLYCLIKTDEEEQYLTGLQGSELTRLVDFLDKVLDVAPISEDIRRQCLHKLQAICGLRATLPSSYTISGDLAKDGDDPVSSGGFSDIWEGTYNGTNVCIKHLKVTKKNRGAVEKAFCREAVIWKRLKHPNIVPFLGVARKPLRFVSEWMPYGTVTEFVNERPYVNRILLLLDIAEGLSYLHGQHVVHADLKGPNILIDHSGRARLTDFGFSSIVRGLDSILVTKVQGFTPWWTAPEVIKTCEKNTQEADVFAFGMVVVEVFTGIHPFSEFTASVAALKIMNGERPDRPQDPFLTESAWDMTLGCWHQDPVYRPAMAKVVQILQECYRLSGVGCSWISGTQKRQGHEATAILDYDPTDPSEISLHKGDTIDMVDITLGDRGWGVNTEDWSEGYFPLCCVEVDSDVRWSTLQYHEEDVESISLPSDEDNIPPTPVDLNPDL